MINPYLPCNEFVPDGEPYVFERTEEIPMAAWFRFKVSGNIAE